ncbi:MAG: excinuclease ABC subunit UvrA, partial [Acidobacteria bacterium]|nr:excinuclease ABC subunit UvrA [Acidobacteriota bacterium]
EVVGARTHNLKGFDCRIPHGRVTVVTGQSGAGKTSLAFDPVFAEGQRRFVESMSTYARQFLDQMERPPVDDISGIMPAVALEARNSVRNARSTVGTLTETHDVLRLLFTHLGEVSCPAGHGAARAFTPVQAAAELADGAAGEEFVLMAPVRRPRKGASKALQELVRQGFGRRLECGEVVRMSSRAIWPADLDPLPLVLGRYKAQPAASSRLVAAIEEAYRLAAGRAMAHGDTARHFSTGPGCPRCGLALRRPVPALFSFNSPLGACPECQGFGRIIGIDRDRVIPDRSRTLEEQPIAPWNTPAYQKRYGRLYSACEERGVPLDVPWRDLPQETRDWIWSGAGPFTNLDRFFAWVEKRSYRVHMRVLLARFRAYDPCPLCRGTRLRPEALSVTVQGRTLPSLTAESVESLRQWLRSVSWSARELEIARHLIDQLGERIEVLHRVGLDYLTLDRQARTLSGGETQRIHLAASLGSGLTHTLYVLDEPTIGLHARDTERLLELLRDLARRGNTVLVVEHDRTLIEGADHVIDLGPGAGENGGQLLMQGTVDELLASDESLTAKFLRRPSRDAKARRHLARRRREQGRRSLEAVLADQPRVRITGAREHNLQGFDVEFPLAALVAVTGVSGSGKSTLVENVLFGNYQRSLGIPEAEPGRCDGLAGLEEVAYVAYVDQYPLGRSSRSNPVTYIKAYDVIRQLFAAEPAALERGITPGHFSFNVGKGRCPECQGTGVHEVDMQFMAPVSVPCDVCLGRRFQRRVLEVRHRRLNIAETLELTVQQAADHFADSKAILRRLGKLLDVGLGYLRLGQPTATLSGGEAQRLKLASFLDRPQSEGRRLFLFDEPTTGLHLSDIDQLYQTLRRLVARRDGVIVVEHNLDLIARCDWIVDLGPGGGVHGGRLLFSGPLSEFLERGEGPTADVLRAHLA